KPSICVYTKHKTFSLSITCTGQGRGEHRMETCHACGAELPPQSRFCSTCGAAQEDMTRPDELTQISSPHVERLPPTLDPEATFIQNTQAPLPPPGDGSNEKTELVSRSAEPREERRGAA